MGARDTFFEHLGNLESKVVLRAEHQLGLCAKARERVRGWLQPQGDNRNRFDAKAWSKAVNRDGHFDGLAFSVRMKRKLGKQIS